jgi:hypothetical protein
MLQEVGHDQHVTAFEQSQRNNKNGRCRSQYEETRANGAMRSRNFLRASSAAQAEHFHEPVHQKPPIKKS